MAFPWKIREIAGNLLSSPWGIFKTAKSQGMAMADLSAASENVTELFICFPTVSRQNHWKDKPFTNSPRFNICNIYLPMVNW